jgi:hypothetical protein
MTRKLAHIMRFLTCFREIHDPNVGWNTEYAESFRNFPQLFQATKKLNHDYFHSHFFSVHYSLYFVQKNFKVRLTISMQLMIS